MTHTPNKQSIREAFEKEVWYATHQRGMMPKDIRKHIMSALDTLLEALAVGSEEILRTPGGFKADAIPQFIRSHKQSQ